MLLFVPDVRHHSSPLFREEEEEHKFNSNKIGNNRHNIKTGTALQRV